MAETIRGLTVVIGAETTGLSKALADVNKQSKDIQSELKQVDRLLKLDPKNTELLAQKQKLLAAQVEATREKLDRLRQVQGQINEQFQKGEISEGQYRAFQREIVETENKLKNFEKQLKNTQDRSKDFAERMGELSQKLESIGKAFAPVSAAAGAVSAGLIGLAVNAGKTADDLNTLSKVTGLSAQTLQKFKYAEDVIDVSTETLAKSLARLTRRMGDAQYGTERTQQAFEKLGVNIYDTSGRLRNSEDVFYDVIAALGKIESQAERDAVSMDLFGRSAQDLNPLILGGADALKQMGDEAERAGLIMSQEALDAINEFNDEIDILKATAGATFTQLGATIGKALMPELQKLADKLKDALAWVRSLDEGTLKTVVTATGLVAAITPLTLVAAKVVSAIKVLAPLITGLASPAGLATMAIGGLVTALGLLATAKERAIRKTEEAIRAQENQVNSVMDLIAEYEELSEKTNQTNEEKERLIELSNTIAEVIPGAVSAYDDEGNALIDLNLALLQTVNLKREEMRLRAQDLNLLIRQAEERKRVAEDEKKRIEEQWAEMNKRWENWKEWPEQERLNELTAEYEQELARVNSELAKSERELKDLQAEQAELAKLSENLTIETIKNEIEKRKAARGTTKVIKEEETTQTEITEEEIKKREQFEQQWTKKRFEQTASRKEILLAEMREELAQAEKLGAEKANIIDYYNHEIAKLQEEEERKWHEEQNNLIKKRIEYEEQWTKKRVEQSADRKKILFAEMQEELKKADELGAKKKDIILYYANEIAKIDKEEREKEIAKVQEWHDLLLQEEENFRLSRAKSVDEEYAIRLAQLEREKKAELKAVDETSAERQAILEYYAFKEKELLDWKEEAYRKSAEASANAFIDFVDTIGSGSKTLVEAIKDMVVSAISALQKKILAEAMAAEAIAWAWSLETLGASLTHLATVAGKVLPQVSVLEALKAGIRSLAEGGKAIAPTLAVIGDNPRYDEAVMPLSPQVFSEIGKGIAEHLPQTQGTKMEIHFHIGTMIGDDRGMKKLAEKVFSYEYSIKQRIGGVGT